MLKRVSIQNFKGIGPRVDIDLRPVTLLFGPNSAGKSTILHAIHYAHALLETGNADVGRTRLGGDVDLGGFKHLVHNHDLDATVALAFQVQPRIPVEVFLSWHEVEGEMVTPEITSFRIDLEVQWSPYLGVPLVTKSRIVADSVDVAELHCTLDGANVSLTNVNLDHPLLGGEGLLKEAFRCVSLKQALPTRDAGMRIEDMDALGGDIATIRILALIDEAFRSLRKELESFRYVGPMRTVPPRSYSSPRQRDESRWACGLGAWDALSGDESLRKRVSEWLGNESLMGTGYQIDWHRYRELDDATYYQMQAAAGNRQLDESFTALTDSLPSEGRLSILDKSKNLELAPCDLGEGIGQVVPVIAAALAPKVFTYTGSEETVELVAIEQPELHIHPRMQVVLGDLFLSQCSERQFLIETHSEHLMLRLLKRIRETSEAELPADAPEATTDTVAVYYVEQEGGAVRLTELRISEDGEFLDRWPAGFFGERLAEML